jgi:formylglycine-generating enzyme required for sulfatase activity
VTSCCAPSNGAGDRQPEIAEPVRAVEPRSAGLVDVPAGAFRMGYDGPLANPGEGEGPERDVYVDAYRIGTTTVTNQQFATFVKATGHVTEAEREGWSFVFHQLVEDESAARGRVSGAEWWWAVDGASWRRPGGPGTDASRLAQHPVVHVSSHDAEAYCAWAGLRLPTEAEWERAARGGLEGAVYPWGDEHPLGRRTPACNIWRGTFPTEHEDGRTGTVAVKSFRPNGYGLHQAVGNVWEWTADSWSVDGVIDEDQRVRRGGSYLCHDSYCNRYRVAARDHSALGDTTGNIGFRVAL